MRRFFFVSRSEHHFEQSSRKNPMMQGSDSGALINEASDENLRGMASELN
jgi:hypothetical protein